MAIPVRYKGKEAEYSRLLVAAGIFEVWHDKSFSDYEGTTFYTDKILSHIDAEAKEGIIMWGNNGNGKSMLLNISFMELMERGKSVFVIDFRHLVKEYIKSWRSNGIINKLLTVDYLGIDDIGKEFSNSDISKELAITALDYVLRYRFQRQKPTWITTNMLLEEFKTAYNPHIASLLKRCSIGLQFTGSDYGDKMFKGFSENSPIVKKKGAFS